MSSLRDRFEDSFFEFRHHAYVEMSWYFGMCLLINLVFGVWGSISVDGDATHAIADSTQRQTCQLINDFTIIFTVICFVDACLNLLSMFTLPSIMRGPKWAGCGLLSLALFGIVLLGKVIAIILGAVWILGKEGALCINVTPKFYDRSKSYFIAVTVVLSLQITVGTLYLLKCGLQDAVEEGVNQLEQEALMRQAREEQRAQRSSSSRRE